MKTDKDDKPTEEQVLLSGTTVLVNPFENLEAEMAEHHRLRTDPEAAKAEEKARLAAEDAQPWYTLTLTRTLTLTLTLTLALSLTVPLTLP